METRRDGLRIFMAGFALIGIHCTAQISDETAPAEALPTDRSDAGPDGHVSDKDAASDAGSGTADAGTDASDASDASPIVDGSTEPECESDLGFDPSYCLGILADPMHPERGTKCKDEGLTICFYPGVLYRCTTIDAGGARTRCSPE